MARILLSLAYCALISAIPAPFAGAATLFTQQAKLTHPLDGIAGAALAVSRDGNIAVVGVPNGASFAYVSGGPLPQSGLLRIYARTGSSWSLLQTLITDSQPNDRDNLGGAVAISRDGTTIVSGAIAARNSGNLHSGAAYIFARGSNGQWAKQAKVYPSDPEENTEFGTAVAINDASDTVIVGKRFGFAAAYVYTRGGTTWTEQQRMPSPTVSGEFGCNVALSADGNLALVGSEAEGPGTAYTFARSGSVWTQQYHFVVPEVDVRDFGRAVGLSADGTTAVISAAFDLGPPNNTVHEYGRAYIFTRSGATWTYQQRLFPADPHMYERVGWSAAISDDGNTVVAGAFPDAANSSPPISPGSAYVFRRIGGVWSQLDKLTASDGASNDQFGYAAAINGDGATVLVGAPNATVAGTPYAGAAYVFVIPPPAPGPAPKPPGPPSGGNPPPQPGQRPQGQPAGSAPNPAPQPRP